MSVWNFKMNTAKLFLAVAALVLSSAIAAPVAEPASESANLDSREKDCDWFC